MVIWPAELDWLAGEPVFSIGDARFTWGDVLVAAELIGAHAELATATRRGLACSRLLAEAGMPLQPEMVRAELTRFRYELNLLSAEELQGWLSRWHLVLDDLTNYLRRALSQAELTDDDLGSAQLVPNDAELSPAMAVDAICSGMLEREARRLATDAALTTHSMAAPGIDRRGVIIKITAEAADARRMLAAATDVEREIGARAIEWTRIDAELVEVSGAETAREVALCVRLDGRSLSELAGELGVPLERRSFYLEQAEDEGLVELLGAGAGELVGPIARNGSFLLLQVLERTRPSAQDQELRQRAVDCALDRAISQACDLQVRWE